MLVFLTDLFGDHAPHVIRQRSKPNTFKSQTRSNPKYIQIKNTLVANSHACFKETSLKTLKPILRQHLQEYKIYKASKTQSFKPLKLCLLKSGDYALPHVFVSHISFWITPLMSYDSAPNQTHSNLKHAQIPNTFKSQIHSNQKHFGC